MNSDSNEVTIRLLESRKMGQYQIKSAAHIKYIKLPGVPRIGERVSYQYWELTVDGVSWNESGWVDVFLVTRGCRGFIVDALPSPPPGHILKEGQHPNGTSILKTVRKWFI